MVVAVQDLQEHTIYKAWHVIVNGVEFYFLQHFTAFSVFMHMFFYDLVVKKYFPQRPYWKELCAHDGQEEYTN